MILLVRMLLHAVDLVDTCGEDVPWVNTCVKRLQCSFEDTSLLAEQNNPTSSWLRDHCVT